MYTIYDVLEQLFKYRSLNLNEVKLNPRDRALLEKLVSTWIERGFALEKSSEIILLSPLDAVVDLIGVGIDPTRFVNYIDWREFEEFIARVLSEAGFEVFRGVEHRGYRAFQIDVLAVDTVSKRALVVECKQWRRVYPRVASLKEAVARHRRRIELLNKYCEWIVVRIPVLRRVKEFIPVIALLKPYKDKVMDGVPLVSIVEMNDFVQNLDLYIEELGICREINRCFVG